MKIPLLIVMLVFGQLVAAMEEQNQQASGPHVIAYFNDERDETIFEFFKIHIQVQKYNEQRAIAQLRRAEQYRMYMGGVMCIAIVSCGFVLYTYFGWEN
ncbi:MAG TPA: hypothetical protein PLU71_03240 [Candidatus Dependentiae bacterium]|nr:hypothetical protein [Candidatus Dependentiae bacterium]HRQ62846.1 hypothetical protein [Candidatus Dependentiae bacterium]